MVPGSSLELQGPEAGWSSSPLPGEERGHQERHLLSPVDGPMERVRAQLLSSVTMEYSVP